MRRMIAACLAAVMFATPIATEARAAVNVTRTGDENPMKEVAKSVIYGGIAGLFVGVSLAVATKDNHNDGDLIRRGFAGGTLAGLGLGLYWVTRRPQPSAALELEDGRLRAGVPAIAFDPDGTARVHLARVRF